MDSEQMAGQLAGWLMMEKKKPRNLAVIISQRKYKLPLRSRSSISKIATQYMRELLGKQQRLI